MRHYYLTQTMHGAFLACSFDTATGDPVLFLTNGCTEDVTGEELQALHDLRSCHSIENPAHYLPLTTNTGEPLDDFYPTGEKHLTDLCQYGTVLRCLWENYFAGAAVAMGTAPTTLCLKDAENIAIENKLSTEMFGRFITMLSQMQKMQEKVLAASHTPVNTVTQKKEGADSFSSLTPLRTPRGSGRATGGGHPRALRHHQKPRAPHRNVAAECLTARVYPR